ncbi:MAG TPA: M28 family peptidase [Sphingobacteriaceae bacterium]
MKSKLLLTVLAAGACIQAGAQNKTAVKYAGTITTEDARKHLTILAGDDFQGRETAGPGAEKAAQYLKKQYQALGLKAPVNGDFFQKVDVKLKTVLARNVSVNGQPLEFLKDFVITPSGFSGPAASYQDVVFVGYGIQSDKYDDLSAADLEGKVAIVLNGEPKSANGTYLITGTDKPSDWTTGRSKKTMALRAKKPALIVTVDPNMARYANMKSSFDRPGYVLGEEKARPGAVNSITLSAAAANKLLAPGGKTIEQLKAGIDETGKFAPVSVKTSLSVDLKTELKPTDSKNVLAYLEGSDPKLKNELIVISSHYDHVGVDENGDVFNGADDDGSGTTGVLEIAEAFVKAKKAGKGPRRSILFLNVVGEEKGLLGSQWYSDNPVFPLANTVTNLNIDMIGRVGFEYKGKADSANYVYVIGSDKLSSTLKEISEKANKTYTNLTLDYKYDDPNDTERIYYRSDHYNFAKHGIPIIFYFNGIHEDYHKVTDEVKKINFGALAKRAQLVFHTAWEIANRDEKPAVDRQNDMPATR